MATSQAAFEFEAPEYRFADPSTLVRRRVANYIGQIVHQKYFRISVLTENTVGFEPRQKGVLRYPPVYVQMPRDPDSIDRYIKMGPTARADITDDNKGPL